MKPGERTTRTKSTIETSASGDDPVEHKCAVCPYSTEILNYYRAHMTTHSRNKPFKCPECPYKSKWKNGVERHLKDVHKSSRPFPCLHPGCNYAAKQKGNLQAHSKIHSSQKSFFCSHPNCKYSTNDKRHLAEHTRTHTGEKPFVCQFESCSYAVTSASGLLSHSRIHTGEKPYKCAEASCEYSATTSSNLKTHQLTHEPKEGEERPSFPCPLCEYSGNSKFHLDSHVKIHTLEKPFICPIESCEYRCKFKSSLSAHLKSHSEERRYKCKLCPFRGKTRANFRHHLKTVHCDPNFRPFKCKEPKCSSAFKNKNGLNKHLLTHKGEKKHACSFSGCDYRSLRPSHVRDHEYYIHSEEKKVNCPICDYKCKTKYSLASHIRTHTKEEPFACKEEGCEYRAKQTAALQQHQKRRHPLN